MQGASAIPASPNGSATRMLGASADATAASGQRQQVSLPRDGCFQALKVLLACVQHPKALMCQTDPQGPANRAASGYKTRTSECFSACHITATMLTCKWLHPPDLCSRLPSMRTTGELPESTTPWSISRISTFKPAVAITCPHNYNNNWCGLISQPDVQNHV